MIDVDHHRARPQRAATTRRGRSLLGAVLLSTAAAIGASASHAQTCAFIANHADDSVSVVNTVAGEVTETLAVGRAPRGIAAGSFGGSEHAVYVTNTDDATVSRIDAGMLTTRTAPVADGPWAIALHPSGLRAYVTHPDLGAVSVLDTTALEVTRTITTGGAPRGAVTSADGSRLYVADGNAAQVIVIDTESDSVLTRFDSGADPVDVSVGAGVLFVSGMPIAVLDQETGNPLGILTAGTELGGTASIADGLFALVATSSASGGVLLFVGKNPAPTLPVVRLGSDAVPADVAPLPDGRHAYVTDRFGDRVMVVDLVELEVVTTIGTGRAPDGIALAPGANGCRADAPVTPTPEAPACTGDCNDDGEVVINELIVGVNVALGSSALDACPAFDADEDGEVAINELIAAVNAALNGC